MEKIITIDEIVWPAQGKKQGQLIDRNGDKYYMFPDKMAGLQVGETIKATEIKSSQFQGRTFYTVAAFEKVGGMSASGGTPTPMINRGMPPPQAPQQSHTMDHERRMDIFVCGALNALLSNEATGGLYATDRNQMISLINDLKYAWKMTLGPNAPKQPVARGRSDNELDDSIPF